MSKESGIDLVLAHIRMVRPTTRLWFDTITPFAVMMVLTNGHPPLFQAMVFIVAMNLIHIAATIVNDLQDIESDRLSSELLRATRPIANGVIPHTLAVTEAAFATVVGIGLTCLISWELAVFVVVLCLMLLLHELPPVRTQSRPILSPLAGAFGLCCILFTMIMAVDYIGIRRSIPFLTFVALYMGLGEMLVKDIRDVDNDAAGGKQTTAVKFGAAKATRMAMLAYIIAGLAWLWFILTYQGLNFIPILIATTIFLCWIIYTGIAAKRLDSSFSKSICRFLHRGSVFIFTLLNLSVILALVESGV
jgi:4-hydroxybenzoate polyprenyltransferase/chlorophyll synthase/homogentisate solanesyltransferase/geranylgeranylglycerol-phosphate geranylgeranyltransferase